MHQLDDAFELSQDEEVKSLTIGLVPVGFSSVPGLEIVQVAAIHIELSSLRMKAAEKPNIGPRTSTFF